MGILRERSERLLRTHPGVSRGSPLITDIPYDETMVKLSKCQTLGTTQIRKEGRQTPSKAVKLLLSRLRSGSQWLTWQDEARLAGNAGDGRDHRFNTCLEGWELMERTLRNSFAYEGCIFGPGETCPPDGPTRCEACRGDQ